MQDVQPNEQPDQPKYACSVYDATLQKNCSDEADTYLDEGRRQCCKEIVTNNCKIRLLKQVCSEEEYARKISNIEQNSNFVWDESPGLYII